MQSKATSVAQYLAELPDDRRHAIKQVREEILENLPEGIVETMNWGMISYEVPLETCPDTYNGKPLMYAALASQKNHMAVYLSGIYANEKLKEQFINDYKQSGKRLDMGKSCVRFKKIEQLPLAVVGWAIGAVSMQDFIDFYQQTRRK